MNKNIKKIIAVILAVNVISTVSPVALGTYFLETKLAYASTYSPSTGELKSLKIKSSNGDILDLRDGYNGNTVKLSDDKEYYAKLTDDSEGININAAVNGGDYIVRIFTSNKADATAYKSGDEILLGKGDTTIYVRTYESLSAYRKAKNEENDVRVCAEEYTLNVRKTTESSYEDNTQDPIYLENIKLSQGDITFVKQKTSYDINVDSSVSEIKITAKPEDDNDRVRINGDLVDANDDYKKTVSLNNGKNEIKVKVTDSEDNQRTYTLNVTRGDSSDSQDDIYLDDLTISEGDIEFSKDEASYDVDVDESVDSVTIGASPEDEGYLVTINGKAVNSDDDYEREIALNKGKNTIEIIIKDEINNKKRTYTLTVNRGQAQDNQDAQNSNSTDSTTAVTNPKSQWVQSSEGWKYYDENGNILKGSWYFDKNQKQYFYLNSDGFRVTGWFKNNNKWYLMDKGGVMLTGWQYADEKWYMLGTDGAMKLGWYKENTSAEANAAVSNTSNTVQAEKWYYLNTDGSMKTGWLQDNEKWYFFNSDGTMVTGTKIIDGKTYKFTDSGALIV
ncbi:cadherin-like beta sandwich domain-containing protein [Clostridium sp.]|uniref:cadherin-like beta sandwich domain-containing protein n=1 Tax=Clostridium sp. TaxID=1506 RepID=UPI0026326E01|nr:cadherin-like beta sandwich domain-containing protein [Clostridium sp.]